MKFIKLFLPMVALALMAIGCTKEYITIEQHQDGSQIATTYCEITPLQWEPNSDSSYWYATFECTSITKEAIENGIILAYCIENGTDNLLPYIIPMWDNTNNVWYMENIRFDVNYDESAKKGYITFILEDSDFGATASVQNLLNNRYTFQMKVCVITNMGRR